MAPRVEILAGDEMRIPFRIRVSWTGSNKSSDRDDESIIRDHLAAGIWCRILPTSKCSVQEQQAGDNKKELYIRRDGIHSLIGWDIAPEFFGLFCENYKTDEIPWIRLRLIILYACLRPLVVNKSRCLGAVRTLMNIFMAYDLYSWFLCSPTPAI